MSVKVRFFSGLIAGAAASGVAALIPPLQAYWLPIGAVVACLVWFREFLWDGVVGFLRFFGID